MRFIALLLLVCGLSACFPPADSSSSTRKFTIRGKVETGAHQRTPLSRGYVGLVGPVGNSGHWVVIDTTRTITNIDGTYVLTVTGPIAFGSVPREYPIFVGASDAEGTLTMLCELSKDLAVEDADIKIDINPVTTVASYMICPGGLLPPPPGSWCHSDPTAASVSNTMMIGSLEGALSGSLIGVQASGSDWGPFAEAFLKDPPTFEAITSNLTKQGVTVGGATATSIASIISAAPLPPVPAPTASTSSSSSSSSSGSGGGGCKLVWDCKSSTQCASVYGKPSGSSPQPNGATCQTNCSQQGACSCQGCK